MKNMNNHEIMRKALQIIGKIITGFFICLTVIIAVLAMCLHQSVQWMFATWTNLRIEELVYQAQTPAQGTNGDMILEYLNQCLAPTILMLIFMLVLIIGLRKKKARYKWGYIVLSIALGCNVILTNVNHVWDKLDVEEYLESQRTSSHYIEENYANPSQVAITFPEQKRNLVYIFLESMESTYASIEVGGAYYDNYIPELTQLACENVSFSNGELLGGLYPLDGATWTMGAMVAQTSGLPLKVNYRNDYIQEDVEILPNAWTIGDILEQQGYHNVIMFGSDGAFAGRKQYFEKHGNYDVLDFYYAKESGWFPEDYHVFWGYEDQKLFEYAKWKLEELSSVEQPFNLTLLTVDTHFEDGYWCEQCQFIYGNQYADVMACSSRQVTDFVRWIQAQPFYENTTIVLVGDHLTMDSDFCLNIDSNYNRTVYNVFINPLAVPVNMKNRQATTMDMFPTTIAALGAEIEGNRLGLGTNLFSEEPTLCEIQGIEEVNKGMRNNSLFYSALAGTDVDDTAMDMK